MGGGVREGGREGGREEGRGGRGEGEWRSKKGCGMRCDSGVSSFYNRWLLYYQLVYIS